MSDGAPLSEQTLSGANKRRTLALTPVLDSWLGVCLQGKVRAAMDSKLVSRELWKLVRPVLKDAGWTSFSSRTATRFSNARIDVVNWEICEHACRPQSVIADHERFTVA